MLRSVMLTAIAILTTLAMPALTLANDAGEEDVVYLNFKTNKGDIMLELYPELAPVTVENFLAYARAGFFEGTIIHRVVPGFVIQGGGFTADGERKETRSPIKNEWRNGLTNDRGTISMARTQDPDSGTSQFFINLKDNESLDTPTAGRALDYVNGAAYAVFGRVVEGMDVVDAIAAMQTRPNPKIAGMPSPVEPVVVESATRPDEDRRQSLLSAHRESREQVVARANARSEELASKVKREVEDKKAINETAGMSNAEQRRVALDHLAEKGYDIDPSKATVTDSGLWYYDLEVGEGASPASPSSRVTVHYTGWFPTGPTFDSSRERGQPAQFGLNQVIKGWTEGVGSMKEGGKRLFIIPAEIGYGAGGRPGIPGNATLVFEVELIDAG